MQYENKETVILTATEVLRGISNKKKSHRKEKIKKYMLNKVLPVVAHIISLLIGGGIMVM